MSKKHPTVCEHCGAEPLEKTWDDDKWCFYCDACFKPVAVSCPVCAGEGVIEEDEYELDWINYGNDLIVCPECEGEGWTAAPSFQ